ncbi:MAG: hypothetical protein KDD61_03100 [Bdellovibrionales bacterium]|nr:hypothetical protein [Bdellovibrionales bacterium]
MKNRNFLILLIVFFVVGCASPVRRGSDQSNGCQVILGAFDIGSGTTKYKVAEVNTCTKKVVRVLFDKGLAVGYKSDLLRQPERRFSKKVQVEGERAIAALLEEGRPFQPEFIVAVATAAFREARNGAEVAKGIQESTKIPVEVISQEREGELGFWAALSQVNLDPNKIVVWDIGGGSLQLTAFDGGKYIIFKSNLASVSLRDWVIEKLKKQDIQKIKTPNPIGESHLKKIQEKVLLETHKVPEALRSKLSDSTVEVLGVGGVHYYSIGGQLNKLGEKYHSSEIYPILVKGSGLSDQVIGGEYASTQIINLALVKYFMDELKIQKVWPVKANNADGLFVHPKYFIDQKRSAQILKRSSE